MKIVNCALLYADGDKYVWSVVTEDASEFPIDMDLVADGSIWENDGTRYVYDLVGHEWKKEESGGGGGTSFPTFTKTGANSWTCDMTFEEAKAVWDAENLGTRVKVCPCIFNGGIAKQWNNMTYVLRSDVEGDTQPPMPSDIVGCLRTGDVYYGDDNKFYGMSAS